MASFSPVELSEYPTPVILIIDIVEKIQSLVDPAHFQGFEGQWNENVR